MALLKKPRKSKTVVLKMVVMKSTTMRKTMGMRMKITKTILKTRSI